MNITLKDNSVIEMAQGSTALEIAEKISAGLARRAVAAKIDGQVRDLSTPVLSDARLEVITLEDEDGLHVMRHTASHVMAEAVLRLFPDAKTAIGPAIDNGFYYDFDVEEPFTTDDLEKIEAEMTKNHPRQRADEAF